METQTEPFTPEVAEVERHRGDDGNFPEFDTDFRNVDISLNIFVHSLFLWILNLITDISINAL